MLLVECLCSSTRVVLPEQDRLVVDELAAWRRDNLPSEIFALEQVKEVQAHRILQEFCKLGFFPIEQILKVVNEAWVFEVITLGENCGKGANLKCLQCPVTTATYNEGSLDWRGTEQTRAQLGTGCAAVRRFRSVGALKTNQKLNF